MEENFLIPWLPCLVYFAYLPMAMLSGMAHFTWGPRAFAPWAGVGLLLRLIAHVVFVCPLVAWPLVLAHGNTTAKPWTEKPWRCFWAVLLLCAPLASLACYVGDVRAPIQYLDIALAVFPPSAIAVWQYRANRSAATFVGVLAVTSFVALYVVGDVLGPLPTYFSYASRGPAIYGWRAACAALAVVLTAVPTRRGFDRRSASLLLAAGTLGLAILLGIQFGELEKPNLFLSSLAIAGGVAALLALRRSSPFAVPSHRLTAALFALVGLCLLETIFLTDASWTAQVQVFAQVWIAGGIVFLGLRVPRTARSYRR